eukprot:Skav215602  [mRNA]  locus=scaffold666:435915:440702:- [translate_table: standard]
MKDMRENRESKALRRASKSLNLRRDRYGWRENSQGAQKGAASRGFDLAETGGKAQHSLTGSTRRITKAPQVSPQGSPQVGEQALSWWISFATLDGFMGTEADVLDGMQFTVPSLGLMSHDAFIQACCAISDVDNPKLLDMEFVGSVLLSVAECLEKFGNEGLDPEDEMLGRSHGVDVLISRQERELRGLARKHGFSFLDIDVLKKDFDKAQIPGRSADRRGEGKLKHEEFHELMSRLMKLPAGQELSDKKKKELWVTATQGWRKQLDLDAFLGFYAHFGR